MEDKKTCDTCKWFRCFKYNYGCKLRQKILLNTEGCGDYEVDNRAWFHKMFNDVMKTKKGE